MNNLLIVKSAMAAILGGMSMKNVIRQLNNAQIYIWETIYPKQGNYYPATMELSLSSEPPQQGRFVFKGMPATRGQLFELLENETIHYKLKAGCQTQK